MALNTSEVVAARAIWDKYILIWEYVKRKKSKRVGPQMVTVRLLRLEFDDEDSDRELPKTDSIQALARFWDTHDLTDIEDELQEVTEPVFAGDDSIRLHLRSRDANAIRRLAESKGVSQAELIGQWVLQKLARRKRDNRASD